jgi:hypothetical protein
MSQQVFIVHQGKKLFDPSLEPQSLHDILLMDENCRLAARARVLSEHGVALALLEYESDVLRFWVFIDQQLKVEYHSSPTFATCTITPPEGTDLELLAGLFGVPEASKAVKQLLLRKRGYGFINEQQRLELLLGLLGLSKA